MFPVAPCYASPMRLGDYIDDYCTRCKLTTDHAVVSMLGEEVKITRCRTCDSEHKYRHNKGSKEMTNKEAFDKVMASASAPTEPVRHPTRRKISGSGARRRKTTFFLPAGKTRLKSSTLQSAMFRGPGKTHPMCCNLLVRLSAATLAVLAATVLAFAQVDATHFSAVMLLGSDSILLQPAKQKLNMLLTVESPEFDHYAVKGEGRDRKVTDPDGNPIAYYPGELSFRFTIGSHSAGDETQPNEFETKVPVDRFQSNLHFRLKVFHGTHVKNYEPSELKMLGVPADIPYDERIYHFTFKLKNVPVEDRMMLEVLDEEGTRVGKFHLQIL